MKKLLVVLLALTFVVSMAVSAFAVTTASVDGKVELTLTSGDQLGGAVDGKITFDLKKDFGEGYSAGLIIKLTPGDNIDVVDPADPDTYPDNVVGVDKASSVAYDGAGWIEIKKDLFTLTLKTDLNANAGNDLGGFCDLTSGPGLQFAFTGIEGLSLTTVINEAPNADNTVDLYNFNVKAGYATDALTLGAAYQMNGVVEGAATGAANDALGVWGSYKVAGITVGAEFGLRPNIGADGANSILVKAGYATDALTFNASYTMKTLGYAVKDAAKYDADADKFSKADTFDYSTAFEASLIKVDASYKLSALTVGGNFQMIIGEGITEDNMSFKVNASYAVSESLSAEAWFKAIDTTNMDTQIGGKVSYTLAAGLVSSLEVTSTTYAGADAELGYTAKITATL